MADKVVDLRIAELLAARLCHELVSPIGAIANGLEILEDEPDFAGDAGALIALSARQAARRLQFYRIAYGATAQLTDEAVRRATVDFFSEGKVSCEWQIAAIPGSWHKFICNLMLLGVEALPRGGRIVLTAGEENGAVVSAVGEGARFAVIVAALLINPTQLDDLSPRTVQAAFTGALAKREHAIVEIRQLTSNELTLVAKMKSRSG